MTDISTTTATSDGPPKEDPSIFGLLNTSDHRRVGRMFMVSAVLMLAASTVLSALVGLDLTDSSDFVVFDAQSWAQAFALTRDALVFLVVIPFFVGLAMFVVPAQIGAGRLVYPRAALASFWTWKISALILIGAYLANGGPYGGTRNNSDGVDLHLIALGTVIVGLLLGVIVVVTTIFSMRAPGLAIDQAPPFTWATLVTGVGLLLTLPVLIAMLTFLYIDHRYSTRFDVDFLGGNVGVWDHLEWVYRAPTLYLFLVPVLGVVAEILPVAARRRVLMPAMSTAAIGAVAMFGLGAWTKLSGVEGASITNGWQGLVYVAMFSGAKLAVLVIIGLHVLTIAQNRKAPPTHAPFLGALGAAVLIGIGVVHGGIGAGLDWLESVDAFTIDPELPLRLTTWNEAQFILTVGAAAVGMAAAISWWAPIIFGRHTNPALSRLSVAALFVGAFIGSLGPALAGQLTGQPTGPTTNAQYDFLADPSTALNTLGAVGLIIMAAGAALLLLDVAVSLVLGKGAAAGPNPWDAFTPEWDATSEGTDAPVLPALTSGTPLLDARNAEEVSV